MGEGLWVSAQPRRAYLGALTGSLELSRPPKQGTPPCNPHLPTQKESPFSAQPPS